MKHLLVHWYSNCFTLESRIKNENKLHPLRFRCCGKLVTNKLPNSSIRFFLKIVSMHIIYFGSAWVSVTFRTHTVNVHSVIFLTLGGL